MTRKGSKRRLKVIWSITGLLALAVAALLLLNVYVVGSAKGRIITEAEAVETGGDCILILGAGVWGDRPSPMLEDRLLQGNQAL